MWQEVSTDFMRSSLEENWLIKLCLGVGNTFVTPIWTEEPRRGREHEGQHYRQTQTIISQWAR